MEYKVVIFLEAMKHFFTSFMVFDKTLNKPIRKFVMTGNKDINEDTEYLLYDLFDIYESNNPDLKTTSNRCKKYHLNGRFLFTDAKISGKKIKDYIAKQNIPLDYVSMNNQSLCYLTSKEIATAINDLLNTVVTFDN